MSCLFYFFFFFKQKTAYQIPKLLEFRRFLFPSPTPRDRSPIRNLFPAVRRVLRARRRGSRLDGRRRRGGSPTTRCGRSEERRVGKECGSGGWRYHEKKKKRSE